MARCLRLVPWLLVGMILLLACGGESEPAARPAPDGSPLIRLAEGERLRVAFVYVSPIGDLGWTWAHNQGRLAIEEQFGTQVETTFLENVPEGPEAAETIRDLAEQGYHLIFTTSYGFLEPTLEVAKEFPNTWFVHISGDQTAPNVSTVFGRMEIPRYLSGMVAGRATKTNKIGYVAAFDLPEVVRGINAFTLGVQAVNPDATVHVLYSNSWFDPPKEDELAQTLLEQGADVLAQHQDSRSTSLAARAMGVYSIGYDSDMSRFAGESVLTSPIWDWGVKYIDIVQQVLDGSYQSEAYYGEEIVDLAPFSFLVDEETRALVAVQEAVLRDGQAEVFCGPIHGNNGVLVVQEGYCLTLEELFTMDWFVAGVQGDAPGEPRPGLGAASSKLPPWQFNESEE